MRPFHTDRSDEATPWPDRAIAELAARQRTMVTTEQLLELPIRPRTITKAVARGRLHRVHRGVHSLVLPGARPPLAAEQAALLACGPEAVLSHHTAAVLHGLRLPNGWPHVIHVTVTGARRNHRGVTVHRTAALDPRERHRVQGLPATSVGRTLVDLAPRYTARQLAPLVDQGLRLTSRAKLLEAVELHPGRPGTPRLRRLLDPARPSADTWSKAEARLLAAIRRAHLPAPEANVPIGPYVADLLWRRQRVIVEYDSERYHSGPAVFHNDRTRHNELSAGARYEVLHVTEEHIANELERVIVWVTLALTRGGGW